MLRIGASPLLLVPRVPVEESHDAFFSGREVTRVLVDLKMVAACACLSQNKRRAFFGCTKNPHRIFSILVVSDPS
tara:strand:- start:951 stop:1175 length:225 start_codon:yes stop_codon:yes gene_type:complete